MSPSPARVFYLLLYLYEKNNIMKKIVRLTEADLTRIVKRVVNEGRVISQISGEKPTATSGTFKFTNNVLELFDAQGRVDSSYYWVDKTQQGQ